MKNLAILRWFFQYFMIHYNIFLHFSVIQYMPDLAIGSKFFQIMFEFFLPKKSLQNWQKKSIFSGAIGDHILGFWTQCKKSQLSRSSRSRKSFFWMTLYQSSITIADHPMLISGMKYGISCRNSHQLLSSLWNEVWNFISEQSPASIL